MHKNVLIYINTQKSINVQIKFAYMNITCVLLIQIISDGIVLMHLLKDINIIYDYSDNLLVFMMVCFLFGYKYKEINDIKQNHSDQRNKGEIEKLPLIRSMRPIIK